MNWWIRAFVFLMSQTGYIYFYLTEQLRYISEKLSKLYDIDWLGLVMEGSFKTFNLNIMYNCKLKNWNFSEWDYQFWITVPSEECNLAFWNKSFNIFSVSPGWGLIKVEHCTLNKRQLSFNDFFTKLVLPDPGGPLIKKPVKFKLENGFLSKIDFNLASCFESPPKSTGFEWFEFNLLWNDSVLISFIEVSSVYLKSFSFPSDDVWKKGRNTNPTFPQHI